MIAIRALLVVLLSGFVVPLDGLARDRNTSPQNYNVGAGTQSCGVWVESRKTLSDDSTLALQSWIQGYLVGTAVGLSVGAGKAAWAFLPPDADALAVWFDNYCKAHPLDNVVTAAGALVNELRKK